jgi:hypothetical protein
LDDRYRIDEGPLARDGLGETWRAVDTVLDRPVTVTVLRAELAADDDFVQWWRQESQRASARPPSPDDSLNVCDFGRTTVETDRGEVTAVYQVARRVELGRDTREHKRPQLAQGRPRRGSDTSWDDYLAERVERIEDPSETLRRARQFIRKAHDVADSGAGEREALVLMTLAAEEYEALDTFVRINGRLPLDWTTT